VWPDSAAATSQFGPSYGKLAVWHADELVWGGDSRTARRDEGISSLWIELLEYLSNYWLYLVLEQGYPFNVTPEQPSQFDRELESRWAQMDDASQAQEEETAYAFRVSHNLAESSAGTLRPDLWLVRDGGVFIVEAQLGPRAAVERLPSADVKSMLTSVGDEIANRLRGATDPRSIKALGAWSIRESRTPEVLAQIATRLPDDYLHETCGADAFDAVFADPAGSGADDNVCLDLAYRCKGALPAGKLRILLDRARSSGGTISESLDKISRAAMQELEAREATLPRAYQQGRALGHWLRRVVVDPSGRGEPKQLLAQWNVVVDKVDFDTRAIDAVAFWAHGRQPNILWNDSEKHRENEGARRATLAHEICHLLVDRPKSLPLSVVQRGAVDRKLEQRANAFAAEFLCPQDDAAAEYRHVADVTQAIKRLTDRFGVSQELAAMQLAKSRAVTDRQHQREIESIGPPGASYPWSF
jgi:Zn-dependent peptidase ImmA (M78 family)